MMFLVIAATTCRCQRGEVGHDIMHFHIPLLHGTTAVHVASAVHVGHSVVDHLHHVAVEVDVILRSRLQPYVWCEGAAGFVLIPDKRSGYRWNRRVHAHHALVVSVIVTISGVIFHGVVLNAH